MVDSLAYPEPEENETEDVRYPRYDLMLERWDENPGSKCDEHALAYKVEGMDQRWNRKAEPGRRCCFCRCDAETKHVEPSGNWVYVCGHCLKHVPFL